MSAPSPELSRLLAADRVVSAPGSSDRERNRRGLARRIGFAAALGTGVAKGSVAGWLWSAGSVKFVTTVALVAAGSGTAAWLASSNRVEPVSASIGTHVSRPAPEPGRALGAAAAAQVAALPAPSAAPPSLVVERQAARPAADARAAEAGTSARTFPGEVDDALARETKLVSQAQAALRAGQAARTLELLAQVSAQFPNGALQEETSATRVFALCQLGKSAEARSAAGGFLQRFPKSLMAERVRTSCGASAFPE